MSAISSKLIITGILFLFTLISGGIVTRSGRPFSVALVTIHKLIAVGTVVLIGMIVYQLNKTIDGTALIRVAAITLSGISFLALIATGALLTREEMQLPTVVLRVHQIAPLLALVSSTITIYLLARGQS